MQEPVHHGDLIFEKQILTDIRNRSHTQDGLFKPAIRSGRRRVTIYLLAFHNMRYGLCYEHVAVCDRGVCRI